MLNEKLIMHLGFVKLGHNCFNFGSLTETYGWSRESYIPSLFIPKSKFYPDIGHTIGYGSNMDLQI